MTWLSDLVLRRRRLVCLLWLLVTVAAVPAAAVTTGRLGFDFSTPGQPGFETSEQIVDRYGNGGSTAPLLVVVTVPAGATVAEREPDVAGVFGAVREELPDTRVVDYPQTRDAALPTDDGRSTVGLVFVAPPVGFGIEEASELTPLLAAQAEATGLQVGLTGYDLLAEGGEAEEPGVPGETLLGGLGALVVLAFVFASFLALVPLLVAAVSILRTFLAVLGLTVVTDVSFIVQFLIGLIGLGVAVDYSLLLVTRWREERAAGRDNDEAVAGGDAYGRRRRRRVRGDRRGVAAGPYSSFPLVLTLIAIATFLLLALTFRSVLPPLKALVLNLLSVAATFGATVLIWQEGFGSGELFGVASTGAITFWLPIIIFAFLFGLSMDYEVSILSRMREEYDRTGSTDAAVVEGLGRTGRLVTSAALILFLAFVALASAPLTDIKVLGTALGIGILLDATVVRAPLVPASVSLSGRWNWWLPVWLARLLRVEPSPATPTR